jgi:hypothetical protein
MAENEGPEVKINGSSPPGSDAPRRRGRPPGSTNKSRLGETPVGGEAPRSGARKRPQIEYDHAAVARQLKGTHFLIGTACGMPELYLEDDQAAELADAMIAFAREYDFEPDSKTMAMLNLCAAAGFVYVPKVLRIAARIKKTKASRGQTIDGVATPVETKDDGTAAH